MTALITPILPWLGVALAAIGALVATWFHGRSSGVKSQQAVVATANAQLAQEQAAQQTTEARAEQDASQALQTAASDRNTVDAAVKAEPAGEPQKELAADWSAPPGK
ncbi:hypothetical protein J4G52_25085 [Burkholderia cenocepacia]|uniref:hypothetical protein n=1 Tax=Burkholderia cenocepacia TaxID=95486 RepID=UPI001AA12451|nr:hypothetical protein [Burkholderia cenocepacia]MBO1856817.1 hypothetical protein [Burkholderia cenocepacia]